jgi:hypothetical protein
VVSPAGAALLRWIDDQPVSAERFWSLVAADLYRCAVSVGRAGDYLAGADLDGLVRRTVALALLRLHPINLLCLPKIHWASRSRPDRVFDERAFGGLAAALDAALCEHGVPSDIRRPLRADLDRHRDGLIRPGRPAGHPYLWPRAQGGTCGPW